MKKLFALSLALVMTLSLAACGGKKTEAPADTENKTETETETPTTGDVKVAVVLKTLASEYWGYVEAGCKAPVMIWVLTWSWLAPALRAISRVRFP